MADAESSRARARAAHAIGGGLFMAGERVAVQIAHLALFVVAARVLGPAEFGVFALVSACAFLLLRVAEGGWQPFILSWSGDPGVPAQVVLIAILSGLVAALLGVAAGFALPVFGVTGEVALLVKLFAVWVMLAVIGAAVKGVMIWQGRLKTSAVVETGCELAGAAVAAAALLSDVGVLSLAIGKLVCQSLYMVLAFAVTRTRPRGGLRGAELRQLLTVSGQLFASRLVYHLRANAATLLVGAFLGPVSVGFYRAAERLVSALSEVVAVPTQMLSWTLFRQVRDAHGGTTEGFQAQAELFFRVLLAVVLPLFAWLAIMGEALIVGLIGAEWLPALPVVMLLAAARVLVVPSFATEAIMSLAGEVRRLPKVSVFYLVATVAGVSAAAPFGLVPLGVMQIAMAALVFGTTAWLFRRYAAIDWGRIAAGMPRMLTAVTLGVAALVLLRGAPFAAEWPPLVRALVLPWPAGAVTSLYITFASAASCIWCLMRANSKFMERLVGLPSAMRMMLR